MKTKLLKKVRKHWWIREVKWRGGSPIYLIYYKDKVQNTYETIQTVEGALAILLIKVAEVYNLKSPGRKDRRINIGNIGIETQQSKGNKTRCCKKSNAVGGSPWQTR